MKKISAVTEVDGDKLKLAREAKGLSQKELAKKLCLSYQHIAQLEDNKLTIFFSHSHKINVAKKVGEALGLNQSDYFIERVIEQKNETNLITQVKQSDTDSLPTKTPQLDSKPKIKITKSRLVFFSALLISTAAIATGSQLLPDESVLLNLGKILTLKTPMSLLNTKQTNKTLSEPEQTQTIEPNAQDTIITVTQDPCSVDEGYTPIYRTTNPSKPAEMVYVLSKDYQTICVIDGQNKVVTFDLQASQSRSVYGQAPFTVVSSDLSQLDLYFQGWRVKVPNSNSKAIRLEATELAHN